MWYNKGYVGADMFQSLIGRLKTADPDEKDGLYTVVSIPHR